MLTLLVQGTELFNEKTKEFSNEEDFVLELEHSLISLSKWESKWEKPFLNKSEKNSEEVLSYVEVMILNQEYPPDIFSRLNNDHIRAINNYLDAKMTATWFNEFPGAPKSREVITSELIYYWMISFNIPFECQYWHLNRLFTLIKVCNLKASKPQKMSRSQMAARNRALNDQRRAQLGTQG